MIEFTKAQGEHVEWALDGIRDLNMNFRLTIEDVLNDKDMAADLLYRLERQIPDLIDGDPLAPAASKRSARNAAGKVRMWLRENRFDLWRQVA